jgi:hypothetical protein
MNQKLAITGSNLDGQSCYFSILAMVLDIILKGPGDVPGAVSLWTFEFMRNTKDG